MRRAALLAPARCIARAPTRVTLRVTPRPSVLPSLRPVHADRQPLHRLQRFLRAPRCSYAEGEGKKPEKGEQKPKPASSGPSREDIIERMLEAEREALAARITKKDTSRNVAPITWWSVGFLVALAAAVSFLLYEEEEQRKRSRKGVGTPKIGGSWTLVDSEGVPRTDHEFRGQYQLVYFGFTYCPDICPVELTKISNVIDAIDAKGLGKYLQPLFITVDAQRDSVHQIREYLKEFHPRLLGLTGTPEQLKNCARAYRVYSMPGLELDAGSPDYLVDHSVIIYLVGPDNKLAEYFGSRQSAAEIAKRVEAHLKSIAPRSLMHRAADGFESLLARVK